LIMASVGPCGDAIESRPKYAGRLEPLTVSLRVRAHFVKEMVE
jgi:hypothetical protein